MPTFLAKFLRLHPKEQKPFWLLALMLAAMMAGLEVTSNISEITFFHRLGVQELPRLYMLEPVVIIILLLFLGTLLDRFGRFKLLFFLNGAMVFGLLVARIFMQVRWEHIYGLTWLMQRVYFGTAPLVFWVLCSDVFNVRQSKRLFPIILVGSLIGATLGNFLTGVLSRYLSAEDILLAAAALFSLALVMVEAVRRVELPTHLIHSDVLSQHQVSFWLPKRLLTQQFLQALYLLMFIIGLLEPILRYQLSAIADKTFTAEEGIIGFFGFIKAGGALVIALFQIFIASRFVERMGVPTTLSILPFGYMALLPVLGLFPNVIVGSAVVASLVTLSTSFHGPARTSALNLFPPEERGRISAFADQLWYVGWLGGSSFLTFAAQRLTLSEINFSAAIFAGLWLLILPTLKKRYVHTCLQSASLPIDQQRFNFPDRAVALKFAPLLPALATLRSASPSIRHRAAATHFTDPSTHAPAIAAQVRHAFEVLLLTTPLTTPVWGKIVREVERGCTEAIFAVLQQTREAPQIRAVRRMVYSPLVTTRAAGLEALESLINFKEVKAPLLTLMSDHTLEEKRLYAQKWLGQAPSQDPAAALETLSHIPDLTLHTQRRQHLNHGDNLLTDSHLEILRQAKAFAALTEEELQALAASARRQTFAAQKIIHEEGQPSQMLCLILAGEVELASAVRQEKVRRLGAGEVFGDISVLSEQPYALTALAATEVTVLIFERETLQELTAYYPNIAFALMRHLALRLGQLRGFWKEED